LSTEPLLALYVGVAVYLLALVGFRYRNLRTINVQRFVVSVLLLALIPVAMQLPALAALVVIAGIVILLVIYEVSKYADARDKIRHGDHVLSDVLPPS
jgi:hypothetical protein